MIKKKKLVEIDRRLTKGRDLLQDTFCELDIGCPIPEELAPYGKELQRLGLDIAKTCYIAMQVFREMRQAAEEKGMVEK